MHFLPNNNNIHKNQFFISLNKIIPQIQNLNQQNKSLELVTFDLRGPLEPAVVHHGGPHHLHVVHLPGAHQGLAPSEHQTIHLRGAILDLLLADVQDGDIGADPGSYPGVLLGSLHHLLPAHHLLPHPPLHSPTHPIHGSLPMRGGKEIPGDVQVLAIAGGSSWGVLVRAGVDTNDGAGRKEWQG